MVAKGEIRRKGRVLKAAMARVQDVRPSLDCARYDGVFTHPRSFATEMGRTRARNQTVMSGRVPQRDATFPPWLELQYFARYVQWSR
jgi:hypothetical protein